MINERIALSAAHCFDEKESLKYFLVNTYESGCSKPTKKAYRNVKVVKHPKWDLALLQFEEPIQNTTPIVNPGKDEVGYSRGNDYCFAGVGITEDGHNLLAHLGHLCQNKIVATELRDRNLIYLKHATDWKAGVDSGDSGGPVFIQTQEGLRLVGITSKGHDGTSEADPRFGGFVDLQESSVVDWITEEQAKVLLRVKEDLNKTIDGFANGKSSNPHVSENEKKDIQVQATFTIETQTANAASAR